MIRHVAARGDIGHAGLHHGDGTISMARTEPGTAQGEFFLIVGPAPYMDANPKAKGDNAGFAAFGSESEQHVAGNHIAQHRVARAHVNHSTSYRHPRRTHGSALAGNLVDGFKWPVHIERPDLFAVRC